MTAGRIRVKDLATELDVNNKDLLQALRDIGVQAKSHMSLLTDEDVENVSAKLKGNAPVTEVIRKEIQPGVIVRRRRKTVAAEEQESDAAEVDVEADMPDEAPEAPEAEAGPGTATAQADEAPAPQEQAVATDVAPPAAAEDEPRFSPARIITPPAPEADATPEEAALPQVTPDVAEEPITAQAPAAPESEAVEPVDAGAVTAGTPAAPQAPAGAADADDVDDEESAQRKKKRKKKREAPTGPQVKIISRPEFTPEPQPVAPAGAPRPAAGPRPAAPRPAAGAPRPGAPRPASPRPGAPYPGRPAPAPAPAGTDDARRKGGRKDKRVVEFGQAGDDARRKTSLQVKKKKTADVPDRTGGKVRSPRRRGGRQDFEYEDQSQQQVTQPLKAAKRKLRVDEAIRVSDMAHQMGVKAQALIKVLMQLGVMSTINQSLDVDTATLVAAEFGYEVEKVGFSEDDFLIPKEVDAPETLKPRPPVVTIMGHVDHGKTSLLDAIRKSNVTAGEAGGITQHIGAYHVGTSKGNIVFLDTPGHEAFTAMRARGAQVTDLVILVVAADDGVMDQTREAVSHSKAAGVPIVVAVNKIDKENANPDRVKRELGDLGMVPEEWGGDTIFAHVSAKQRIGLEELLEMVALQAEVLELKANPDKPARGHIVEAKLDKGRGPVGTVLVQEGTLRQGDAFVCGKFSGRVRALFNDQGKKVKEAGPSIPVEVQGFEGVPEAGDEFVCVADDKMARRIADTRATKQRERDLAKDTKVTLETFLATRADAAEAQTLNLILKSDVQGSLEAIADALKKLSTDQVKVNVIHGGAGAITESDILLASASQAIIIGFNVRPTVKVKYLAEQEGVDIRYYDIIYKLVSEVKDAMTGMLAPVIKEVYLGQVEVRQTFSVPKIGVIAGCHVADGKITRNAGVRLLRGGVVVYTGKITSLKRFKDDVKEVAKGYECGIGLENFNDIKVGDFIEAFDHVEVAQTL
ncbi:MAG: translation initiation factor IF-2 [Desulfovibrionaceae bacterium]